MIWQTTTNRPVASYWDNEKIKFWFTVLLQASASILIIILDAEWPNLMRGIGVACIGVIYLIDSAATVVVTYDYIRKHQEDGNFRKPAGVYSRAVKRPSVKTGQDFIKSGAKNEYKLENMELQTTPKMSPRRRETERDIVHLEGSEIVAKDFLSTQHQNTTATNEYPLQVISPPKGQQQSSSSNITDTKVKLERSTLSESAAKRSPKVDAAPNKQVVSLNTVVRTEFAFQHRRQLVCFIISLVLTACAMIAGCAVVIWRFATEFDWNKKYSEVPRTARTNHLSVICFSVLLCHFFSWSNPFRNCATRATEKWEMRSGMSMMSVQAFAPCTTPAVVEKLVHRMQKK